MQDYFLSTRLCISELHFYHICTEDSLSCIKNHGHYISNRPGVQQLQFLIICHSGDLVALFGTASPPCFGIAVATDIILCDIHECPLCGSRDMILKENADFHWPQMLFRQGRGKRSRPRFKNRQTAGHGPHKRLLTLRSFCFLDGTRTCCDAGRCFL